MHEILKRALDEALTGAYAAELPGGAEETVFSEDFEREMRGLIRRTDRPIQKYIPILTAAACAVIAIGCAVLLPRLLSDRIPVEPNEDGTVTSVSSAPVIEEPVESTSVTETVPDDTEKIRDENPGAVGAGFADEPLLSDQEDTTERDDEDGVGGEIDAPTAGSSEETSPPVPAETDPPETEIPDYEEILEEDAADNAEDDSDSEDSIPTDDDMDYDSVDDDMDYDSDDDVSYDSDHDDIAIDEDNDEETDESALQPIEKRDSLDEEIRALLGCSLSDSYLHYGGGYVNGKRYELPIVEGISPETYRDPALAELIGAAKYIGGEPGEVGLPLFTGNIGKAAPVIPPVRESDQSDRNSYDEIYFGEEAWVADEEDEIDTPTETVYLEIFPNGNVCVRKEGYGGEAYYRLEDEALQKLAERIETRFSVKEPETVGELTEQLGSAEDYAQVYVGIRNYYDCTMYGELSDGSFLEALLRKYRKAEIRKEETYGNAPIQISLTSRKSLRTENLMFYSDGTVKMLGGGVFKIDESEVRAVLTEYCRQKGLAPPVFYETLGEYLVGKNFTVLNAARIYARDMSDDVSFSGDDAEIRALVEKYAAESELLPDGRGVSFGERESITLEPAGWFPSLRISRNEIQIGYSGNIFKTPDGLYDKLYAIISEKGESPYTAQDEDYYDDDVVYED